MWLDKMKVAFSARFCRCIFVFVNAAKFQT